MLKISVVVLTYNEEQNLHRCLKSVYGWADEIFIVDSYSTDETEQIARLYTNNFIQHTYESHPAQWLWSLHHLPFKHQWVFAVDADWTLSEELKQELNQRLLQLPDDVSGIYVRHKEIFRGRFIRHGTIYPRYWLRIFRPESVFVDEHDLVDLHFYVKGNVINFETDVIEQNAKEDNLEFWVSKQIRFAQRAAVEELRRRHSTELAPVQPSLFGTPDQRTLWLKSRWYFLPLYWRSVAYYLYRYIVRFGFLDGRQGFLYHTTQALIYRLMVDAKIEELQSSNIDHSEIAKYAKPLGPHTQSHQAN